MPPKSSATPSKKTPSRSASPAPGKGKASSSSPSGGSKKGGKAKQKGGGTKSPSKGLAYMMASSDDDDDDDEDGGYDADGNFIPNPKRDAENGSQTLLNGKSGKNSGNDSPKGNGKGGNNGRKSPLKGGGKRAAGSSPTPADGADGGVPPPHPHVETMVDDASRITGMFQEMMGPKASVDTINNDFYNFMHYHQLKLAEEEPVHRQRAEVRRARMAQKKLDDEEARIRALRTDPKNLRRCATLIQKHIRGLNERRLVRNGKQFLTERARKVALVIIIDEFSTKAAQRIPIDGFVVDEGRRLAQSLIAAGYHVTVMSASAAHAGRTPLQPVHGGNAAQQQSNSAASAAAAAAAGATSPAAKGGGGAAPPSLPSVPQQQQQQQQQQQFYIPPSAAQLLAPTRDNILDQLRDLAVLCDNEDTMAWVHICGAGGLGMISGKNPLKARDERDNIVTPRHRVLSALEAFCSEEVSRDKDSLPFLIPSDCDTPFNERFTHDSIVHLEEVLDIVMNPRASQSCLGFTNSRPCNQRIVSFDLSSSGYDGHVGSLSGLVSSIGGGKVFRGAPPNFAKFPSTVDAVNAAAANGDDDEDGGFSPYHGHSRGGGGGGSIFGLTDVHTNDSDEAMPMMGGGGSGFGSGGPNSGVLSHYSAEGAGSTVASAMGHRELQGLLTHAILLGLHGHSWQMCDGNGDFALAAAAAAAAANGGVGGGQHPAAAAGGGHPHHHHLNPSAPHGHPLRGAAALLDVAAPKPPPPMMEGADGDGVSPPAAFSSSFNNGNPFSFNNGGGSVAPSSDPDSCPFNAVEKGSEFALFGGRSALNPNVDLSPFEFEGSLAVPGAATELIRVDREDRDDDDNEGGGVALTSARTTASSNASHPQSSSSPSSSSLFPAVRFLTLLKFVEFYMNSHGLQTQEVEARSQHDALTGNFISPQEQKQLMLRGVGGDYQMQQQGLDGNGSANDSASPAKTATATATAVTAPQQQTASTTLAQILAAAAASTSSNSNGGGGGGKSPSKDPSQQQQQSLAALPPLKPQSITSVLCRGDWGDFFVMGGDKSRVDGAFAALQAMEVTSLGSCYASTASSSASSGAAGPISPLVTVVGTLGVMFAPQRQLSGFPTLHLTHVPSAQNFFFDLVAEEEAEKEEEDRRRAESMKQGNNSVLAPARPTVVVTASTPAEAAMGGSGLPLRATFAPFENNGGNGRASDFFANNADGSSKKKSALPFADDKLPLFVHQSVLLKDPSQEYCMLPITVQQFRDFAREQRRQMGVLRQVAVNITVRLDLTDVAKRNGDEYRRQIQSFDVPPSLGNIPNNVLHIKKGTVALKQGAAQQLPIICQTTSFASLVTHHQNHYYCPAAAVSQQQQQNHNQMSSLNASGAVLSPMRSPPPSPSPHQKKNAVGSNHHLSPLVGGGSMTALGGPSMSLLPPAPPAVDENGRLILLHPLSSPSLLAVANSSPFDASSSHSNLPFSTYAPPLSPSPSSSSSPPPPPAVSKTAPQYHQHQHLDAEVSTALCHFIRTMATTDPTLQQHSFSAHRSLISRMQINTKSLQKRNLILSLRINEPQTVMATLAEFNAYFTQQNKSIPMLLQFLLKGSGCAHFLPQPPAPTATSAAGSSSAAAAAANNNSIHVSAGNNTDSNTSAASAASGGGANVSAQLHQQLHKQLLYERIPPMLHFKEVSHMEGGAIPYDPNPCVFTETSVSAAAVAAYQQQQQQQQQHSLPTVAAAAMGTEVGLAIQQQQQQHQVPSPQHPTITIYYSVTTADDAAAPSSTEPNGSSTAAMNQRSHVRIVLYNMNDDQLSTVMARVPMVSSLTFGGPRSRPVAHSDYNVGLPQMMAAAPSSSSASSSLPSMCPNPFSFHGAPFLPRLVVTKVETEITVGAMLPVESAGALAHQSRGIQPLAFSSEVAGSRLAGRRRASSVANLFGGGAAMKKEPKASVAATAGGAAQQRNNTVMTTNNGAGAAGRPSHDTNTTAAAMVNRFTAELQRVVNDPYPAVGLGGSGGRGKNNGNNKAAAAAHQHHHHLVGSGGLAGLRLGRRFMVRSQQHSRRYQDAFNEKFCFVKVPSMNRYALMEALYASVSAANGGGAPTTTSSPMGNSTNNNATTTPPPAPTVSPRMLSLIRFIATTASIANCAVIGPHRMNDWGDATLRSLLSLETSKPHPINAPPQKQWEASRPVGGVLAGCEKGPAWGPSLTEANAETLGAPSNAQRMMRAWADEDDGDGGGVGGGGNNTNGGNDDGLDEDGNPLNIMQQRSSNNATTGGQPTKGSKVTSPRSPSSGGDSSSAGDIGSSNANSNNGSAALLASIEGLSSQINALTDTVVGSFIHFPPPALHFKVPIVQSDDGASSGAIGVGLGTPGIGNNAAAHAVNAIAAMRLSAAMSLDAALISSPSAAGVVPSSPTASSPNHHHPHGTTTRARFAAAASAAATIQQQQQNDSIATNISALSQPSSPSHQRQQQQPPSSAGAAAPTPTSAAQQRSNTNNTNSYAIGSKRSGLVNTSSSMISSTTTLSGGGVGGGGGGNNSSITTSPLPPTIRRGGAISRQSAISTIGGGAASGGAMVLTGADPLGTPALGEPTAAGASASASSLAQSSLPLASQTSAATSALAPPPPPPPMSSSVLLIRNLTMNATTAKEREAILKRAHLRALIEVFRRRQLFIRVCYPSLSAAPPLMAPASHYHPALCLLVFSNPPPHTMSSATTAAASGGGGGSGATAAAVATASYNPSVLLDQRLRQLQEFADAQRRFALSGNMQFGYWDLSAPSSPSPSSGPSSTGAGGIGFGSSGGIAGGNANLHHNHFGPPPPHFNATVVPTTGGGGGGGGFTSNHHHNSNSVANANATSVSTMATANTSNNPLSLHTAYGMVAPLLFATPSSLMALPSSLAPSRNGGGGGLGGPHSLDSTQTGLNLTSGTNTANANANANANGAMGNKDACPLRALTALIRSSLLPPADYPALLIVEPHRRRLYRVLWSGAEFFPSAVISHFCDEFLRGALLELLPPVKGARVTGPPQRMRHVLVGIY